MTNLWDTLPTDMQDIIIAKAGQLEEDDYKGWLIERQDFNEYTDETFWGSLWNDTPNQNGRGHMDGVFDAYLEGDEYYKHFKFYYGDGIGHRYKIDALMDRWFKKLTKRT